MSGTFREKTPAQTSDIVLRNLKKLRRSCERAASEYRFIPSEDITLIVPCSAEDAYVKLFCATQPSLVQEGYAAPPRKYLFNGRIENSNFRISRVINYPNNFLPVIEGRIEDTSFDSCIIFLQYRMFQSTKYMLGLITLLTLTMILVSLPSGFVQPLFWAGLLALYYWVTISGFHKQKRISHELLCKIFEENEEEAY